MDIEAAACTVVVCETAGFLFLFHLYVNRDGVTCLAFDRGGVFLTEGRNGFRNKYGLMNVSMQARGKIILVHQLSCVKTYSKVLMQQLYCVKYTHSVLFRFVCIITLS